MNLRDMVDGVGSLQLNVTPQKSKHKFTVQQEVVIRRPVNRSGPPTSQVVVGRILAMGNGVATVSIQRAGGVTERKIVNLREISPVTAAFRRSSVQFSPQYRGRV